MISIDLKNVILKRLKLQDYEILNETKANTIPGWDSLSHLSILMEVEKVFGIKFKMPEILRLRNIGDLQNLVDAKMKEKNL